MHLFATINYCYIFAQSKTGMTDADTTTALEHDQLRTEATWVRAYAEIFLQLLLSPLDVARLFLFILTRLSNAPSFNCN